MSEFFNAIFDQRKGFQDNLFTSFGFKKLEKSHIEYTFGDSSDFKISKTGKEIKEKLNDMMIAEQQEIANYTNIIYNLKSRINENPEGDAQSEFYYLLDGFEDKVGVLPGQPFTWKQCDCNRIVSDDDAPSFSNDSSKKEESQSDLMCQYNEALRKWIGCKREIAMLNTMLNNFVDNQSYNLSVKVATTLGF